MRSSERSDESGLSKHDIKRATSCVGYSKALQAPQILPMRREECGTTRILRDMSTVSNSSNMIRMHSYRVYFSLSLYSPQCILSSHSRELCDLMVGSSDQPLILSGDLFMIQDFQPKCGRKLHEKPYMRRRVPHHQAEGRPALGTSCNIISSRAISKW